MTSEGMNAVEALKKLKEGNQRFAQAIAKQYVHVERIKELSQQNQRPFACILTCSDSRIPVEHVFDQTAGDLFVIRVAGNVIQPSQIASIEYAVAELQVKLCVIMGHSRCGAVTAAAHCVLKDAPPKSSHLAALIDLIKPAVLKVCPNKSDHANQITEPLIDQMIHTHASMTADDLLKKSPYLNEQANSGNFVVKTAYFNLETAKVEF